MNIKCIVQSVTDNTSGISSDKKRGKQRVVGLLTLESDVEGVQVSGQFQIITQGASLDALVINQEIDLQVALPSGGAGTAGGTS